MSDNQNQKPVDQASVSATTSDASLLERDNRGRKPKSAEHTKEIDELSKTFKMAKNKLKKDIKQLEEKYRVDRIAINDKYKPKDQSNVVQDEIKRLKDELEEKKKLLSEKRGRPRKEK